MPGEPTLITQLLAAVGRGEPAALDRLGAEVYDELHRMAHAYMAREGPGRTLQPTALVSEAWLRLAAGDGTFENRRHFFGAAAKAMHRILVDDARRRGCLKRGGHTHRRMDAETIGPLTHGSRAEPVISDGDPAFILAMDEALATLNAERPDLADLHRADAGRDGRGVGRGAADRGQPMASGACAALRNVDRRRRLSSRRT